MNFNRHALHKASGETHTVCVLGSLALSNSRNGKRPMLRSHFHPGPAPADATPGGFAPRPDGSRTEGPRASGFTLVEILVVVALLGVAALIVTANMGTVLRRSQLEGTTTELTSFLDAVPRAAFERRAPVFLQWSSSTRTFAVTTDAAGASVLDTFRLPDSVNATVGLPATLRCDTIGRAYVGTNGVMLGNVQTVQLAQAAGYDSPIYTLTLSPLWAVVVTKQMS